MRPLYTKFSLVFLFFLLSLSNSPIAMVSSVDNDLTTKDKTKEITNPIKSRNEVGGKNDRPKKDETFPSPTKKKAKVLQIPPIILNEDVKRMPSFTPLAILGKGLQPIKTNFNKETNYNKIVGPDPFRFTITSNKDSIAVGEEIELTIAVDWMDFGINNGVRFLPEWYKYTLRVVPPKGFTQTGGDYVDFCTKLVDANNPQAVFTIKGKFEFKPEEAKFMVLRGFEGFNKDSEFIYKSEIKLLIRKNRKSSARLPICDEEGTNTSPTWKYTDGCYDVTNFPYKRTKKEDTNRCSDTYGTILFEDYWGDTGETDCRDGDLYKRQSRRISCIALSNVNSENSNSLSPDPDYKWILSKANSEECGCTTPSAPAVIPKSRCGSGIVALGASCTSGTENWYESATGGSSIETGTSFSTPVLSSTTTYYVSCVTSPSCESSRTSVTATVTASTTTGSETKTICSGESYKWPANNVTYTTSQSGVTVVTGCNTATLNLTVTASTTTGSETKTICSGESYKWPANNTTYTTSQSGVTVVSGCNTATLNLTVTPSTTDGSITKTICSGESYTWPANNVTYTTSQSGITVISGCNTATLNLTVNSTRVPTILGATSRCSSSTTEIELTAFGCSGTVIWEPAGSTNLIKVKPTVSTNYRANCTENGCTGGWSSDHTITVVTPPDGPSISGDTEICPSGSTTLTASTCDGSLLWSTGATTQWISASVGTYKVTCTKDGCKSGEGSHIVTAKAVTKPTISPASASICSDGSRNFTINSGVCDAETISWRSINTGELVLGNGSTLSSRTDPTTYYVSCTNNGCTTGNFATLRKAPPITAQITPSSTIYICQGSNLTLTALDAGSGTTYDWSSTGYSTNGNPVTRSYVAGQSLAGTYTLNVSRVLSDYNNITCNASTNAIVSVTSPTIGGTIVVAPGSQLNICEAEGLAPNTFSISGNTGNIIRWEKKLASATTWTNCGGTAASSCTFTTAGDWRIRAIVKNGVCAEVASTEGSVNVVPEASISIRPEDGYLNTICAGGNTVLYAEVANGLGCTISWQYRDASTGSVWTNTTPASTYINRISTGILTSNRTYRANYTCTGTNCSSVVSNELLITVNQPINGVADGSEVCAGKTISITSSGGDAYQWSGPNSYASNQANNTIANSTSVNSGTYTIVISRLGCPSITKTVTVNVKPLPVVTASCPTCVTAITDGCTILTMGSPRQGDTNFELRANVGNGSSTYKWTGPNGFVSNEQNPIIPTLSTPPTKVELNMTGIYTVTPTLSGCTATSTVSVTVVPSCNLTFKSGFPKVTCNNFKGTILLEICGQTTGKTLEYKLEIKDANGNFVTVSNWNINASTLTNLSDGTYRVNVRETGSGDGYGSSGSPATCADSREVIIKNSIKCEDIVLKSTTQAGVVTNEITVKADGTVPFVKLTADISAALPTATPTCPNPTATYFWTGPNGFTANIKDIQVRIPGIYKVKITFTQGGSTNFECNLEKELTMNYTPLPIDPGYVQVRCIGNKSYAWVTSGTGIMTKPEFSIDLVNWTTYYDFELIGGVAGDKFKIFVRDGNATSKVKLMAEVVKTSCDCGLAVGSSFVATLPVIECTTGGASTTSLLAYKYNGSTYDYTFQYKLKKDGAFIIPDWTAPATGWTVLPYALSPGNYTFFAKNGNCEASVNFTIKPATTVSEPDYGCNLQLIAEATLDASLNRKVSVKNQDSWSGNGLWFNGRYTDASIGNANHTEVGTSKKFTFETWINPDNQQNIKLFTPSETSVQNAASGLFYQKQHYLAYSNPESGMNGFALSVAGNGINVIEYHTNGNVNIIKSLPYAFTGWTHLTVNYDQTLSTGQYKIFFNGVYVTSANSFNPGVVTHPPTMLGSWAYGAYKGKVDNLRIWKTAKSEEEITKNMKKVLVSANADLLRNYLFDETTGRPITDRAKSAPSLLSTADCSMRISAADNPLYPADYTWTTPAGFLATGEEVLIPYCETTTDYNVQTQKPDGTLCSTTYRCTPKPECSDMPVSIVPTTDIIEYSGALVKLIANPNIATLPSSTFNLNESAYFNEQNSRIDFGSRGYENNFTVEGWIKPEINDIDLINNRNTPFNDYTQWNWNFVDQSYWMAPNFTTEYKAGTFVSVGSNGVRVFEFVNNVAAGWSSYRSRIEYEFPDKPKTSWAHVAVVYENKKAKLYVDGNLVKEATVISDVPVYAPSYMGDNANRQNSFKGSTDEVRVWNSARSATQIKDNMYGTATASGASSYYKFNNPSNSVDGFVTQNLSPQNITFTPATPATLSNTDYSKITWWRNGVQVGTGKEYVIPQSDIVAGKKLYTAKITRPDNTICETDKLVTILPQPACDVTTGCFVVTGLNTSTSSVPLVWYGPAKDDATTTSLIKSIRTSKALGFANQSWRVTCLGGQNYKIISNLDGKALELSSGKVILANNGDKDSQKWKFYVITTPGVKIYRISPFNDPTKALTMSVNSNDLLTLENLVGATGDDSQKFIFASKPCLVEGTTCATTGELTYERWNFSLPTDDGYATKDNPEISTVDWTSTADEVDVITNGAEIPNAKRERPEDNYYAVRLSGYICPPESAQYEFFGAADDRFELWVSTDDQPSKITKVALSVATMGSRGYSETDQGGITKSSPLGLLKNTKYYFELRMKEITGNDNASVAWRKVGDNTAANALTPIDPQYLSPYERCGINVKITPDAKKSLGTYLIGDKIRLKAIKPSNETTEPTYVWKGADLQDEAGNYVTELIQPVGGDVLVVPRNTKDSVYKVYKLSDPTCFKIVRIRIRDAKCQCTDCDADEWQTQKVNVSAAFAETGKNYVVENTYLGKSLTETGTTEINQKITYLDGLGRTLQVISRGQSPTGKDLVLPVEFDGFGRNARSYMPYVSSTGGAFQGSSITDQAAFYNTLKGDNKAYKQAIFEDSPLNRIIKKGSIGSPWQPTTDISDFNDNSSKSKYRHNIASDGIKKLEMVKDGSVWKVKVTDYLANALMVSESYNAKNQKVETFTDGGGGMVCKKMYNGTTDILFTYNVYDFFGRLRYVFPPLASANLANTAGVTPENEANYKDLIFYYQYDEKGRTIISKTPDTELEEVVYNPLGQVVLVRNPLQKTKNVWMYSKYDEIGRVYQTGIYGVSTDRITLQNSVNTLFCETCTIGYSASAFPTGTAVEALVTNYYDNYSFTSKGTPETVDEFTLADVISSTSSITTKGKLTGKKEKVLKASSSSADLNKMELTSIFYYDKYGRVVQTREENHMNSEDISSAKFDWAGRINETKLVTKAYGSDANKIYQKNTYDYGNRLKMVCQQVNGGQKEPVGRYTYNEIGELTDKILGCKQQVVSYQTNIRGWLLGINATKNDELKATVNNAALLTDKKFFGLSLEYDADQMIKGQSWASVAHFRQGATAGLTRKYDYLYDELDRLKNANYAGGLPAEDFSVKDMNYDLNGNIKRLKRKTSSSGGFEDDLTYNYQTNSNRLLSVDDAGVAISSVATRKHYFNDRFTGGNDYVYDISGNVIEDKNRKVKIEYNIIGQPIKIEHYGTVPSTFIEYYYTASGEKLRKTNATLQQGNNVTAPVKMDYVAGLVYTAEQLSFIPTAEGRALPPIQNWDDGTATGMKANAFRYEYQIKDNIGNLRAACRCGEKYNSNNQLVGEVGTEDPRNLMQEAHFDPWGLNLSDIELVGKDKHLWQANGSTEKGLLPDGSFDYEATFRFYDPAIGRFKAVDPMAIEQASLSPFQFGENNPISLTDPSGLCPECIAAFFGKLIKNGTEFISKAGGKYVYSVAKGSAANGVWDRISGELAQVVVKPAKDEIGNLLLKSAISGMNRQAITGLIINFPKIKIEQNDSYKKLLIWEKSSDKTSDKFYAAGYELGYDFKGGMGEIMSERHVKVTGFKVEANNYTGKGKYNAALSGSVKAAGIVGNYSEKLGTEQFNVGLDAEGSVLAAEANVDAGILTGENDKYGVNFGVDAIATALKGEVNQSFTAFGIKVGATEGGMFGTLGAGAGAGAFLEPGKGVLTFQFHIQGAFGIGGKIGGKIEIPIFGKKK